MRFANDLFSIDVFFDAGIDVAIEDWWSDAISKLLIQKFNLLHFFSKCKNSIEIVFVNNSFYIHIFVRTKDAYHIYF